VVDWDSNFQLSPSPSPDKSDYRTSFLRAPNHGRGYELCDPVQTSWSAAGKLQGNKISSTKHTLTTPTLGTKCPGCAKRNRPAASARLSGIWSIGWWEALLPTVIGKYAAFR
jgi:hypothetical protein